MKKKPNDGNSNNNNGVSNKSSAKLSVDSGTNVDLKSQQRKVDLSTETTNSTHQFTNGSSVPALLQQIEELQKN